MWVTMAPPSRPSRSVGRNQDEMPSAVAMASQTCSGDAASSKRISRRRGTSGVLMGLLRDGMGGDDQPVGPPVVVVVAAGEFQDRGGEVLGKGGPVLGGAEPDLGVDGQGGQQGAGGFGQAGPDTDLW